MVKNREIRPFVIIGTFMGAFILVFVLSIAFKAFRQTYSSLSLNDICPNYFQSQYAWVTDSSGNPLDSVSVSLYDNSQINVIYHTFTDNNGRFELFNDFGSFALSKLPFSYELHVSFDGYADSIIYKFKRYKICHFKKTSGPDTIIINLKKNRTAVTGRNPIHVAVEKCFDYAPFEKMAVSKSMSSGLSNPLKNWNTVSYGTISIVNHRVCFAIAENGPGLNGIYCIFDRNGNMDLNDDEPKLWKLLVSNSVSDVPDCDIRQCFLRDTLYFDNKSYVLDFQLGGFHHETYLLFRRGDAIVTEIPIDGRIIKTALWDRSFRDFSDLRYVQIAVDRNGDRIFSSLPGDVELLETALYGFPVDSVYYDIDSIYPDGNNIVFKSKSITGFTGQNASEGAWTADFKSWYAQPVSLYSQIASNHLVVLYFFEGNSATFMDSPLVKTIVDILSKRAGRIQLIGVNRKTSGDYYDKGVVIGENRGWKGEIVRKFHNHMEREMICIDNTGTIISRGEPGAEFVEKILRKLGVKDPEKDLAQF